MIGPLLIVVAVMAAVRSRIPRRASSIVRPTVRPTRRRGSRPGHDADAHVRLALWCEQHGMTAERMKHLATAVLYDPSNALARGLMGLVAFTTASGSAPTTSAARPRRTQAPGAAGRVPGQRRAKAADTADDQWKLAIWCEQNGLKDAGDRPLPAVVTRLDPGREAAWKHLGFKKVGGRWVKPEWQAAAKREADEQNRRRQALEAAPGAVAIGGSPAGIRAGGPDAEAGLAGVTDPRAVPMVWTVFVPRGAEGQKVAVRVLGQIDAPGSSRSLALLALMSPNAEVRSERHPDAAAARSQGLRPASGRADPRHDQV